MSITTRLAAVRPKLKTTTLIAVSKMHPLDAVREALAAKQHVFGENRVQEAVKKFTPLRQEGHNIELHLIGALQTNKARLAVDFFDVIQTLDRPALAEAIADALAKTKKTPRLYIEVNIGSEPQKAGILPQDTKAFLALCRERYGLSVTGLMCIPPQGKDPRPFFEALKNMADTLSLPHVSMGMSADFETAIACGATEVRLGSILFGTRES